jgi:ribosomal protein L1
VATKTVRSGTDLLAGLAELDDHELIRNILAMRQEERSLARQEAKRRGIKDVNVMMTTGAVPRRLGQAPQYSEN